VSVLFGNGDGTFGPAVNLAVGSGASSVSVGDFNHDGKLDLAVTLALSDTVAILLGNGDGTFQPPVTYPTGGRPEALAVGDFNGDGSLDLAVGSFAPNIVSVLLGNGDGTFQTHVDYAAGGTPESLTVADLNGDGKLDLAVANETSNSVSILLGNGDGTFQPHVDYPTGTEPYGLTTGDFNGDGKVDLAVVNAADSTVSLLLGNGDGTFQAHVDYAVGSAPDYVAAGDFDNNGRLDLASANQLGSSVSELLNVAAPIPLVQTSVKFPTQLVGTSSAPKAATLTNTGTAALTITGIAASGNFSQTNTCGSSVTVNASCNISITFTPTVAGQRTGSITITDNASGSPQTISLTGEGTVVSLAPEKLNFGDQLVGTTSAAKTVTLTNTRTTSLSITSIAIAGTNPGEFGLPPSTCPVTPSTLGAGASCTISVTFTPTAAGAWSASISIADNGGGSPQTVVLTGSGTVVKLAPARLIFGSETVGTTSPAKTVQLTNTGATSLSITSITVMGADPHDFSPTSSCPISPATLGVGVSCLIHVTFTPTATGARTAFLAVSDGGGGSPQVVSLSGTGN
jgi:hypothetical protein